MTADDQGRESRDDPVPATPGERAESASQRPFGAPGHGVTVVGIGASAGGLVTLRELLSALPADTGMSFVIVVHLSPDQRSHLADLLQPTSPMSVVQVTESTPLRPDTVYVIPPGRNLSAVDSHLRLSDLEAERSHRHPIDHFFRTLAASYDGNSIGVILSGTGSDGTVGLQAIREAGGVTLVQDPSEAEYDGMPQSALATGTVDIVDTVAGIAGRLVQLSHVGASIPSDIADVAGVGVGAALREIYTQIHEHTGRDMSGYKESTLLRRVRRRMQLHEIIEFDSYVDLLRETPDEVDRLFNDILISVTTFFRDREVFDAIADQVLPEIFAGRDGSDTVRIWSVGCSTGEEAYSLAILAREHTEQLHDPPQVQIFATDLHERSIERAREGRYPLSIDTDVSPARLHRFFVSDNDTYRVRSELRELIVFAPHGLLSDPPFSHIDLVVCRNLLIYLQRDTQRRAADVFHYALDPGGHLVLGSAESLERSDRFSTVDKANCIYRRRDVGRATPELPMERLPRRRHDDETEVRQADVGPPSGYRTLHTQFLEQHAPPSILIDDQHRIVHLSAHGGRYLVHPEGEPTSEVFALVPEDLRLELRTTVFAAQAEGVAMRSRAVPVRIDGQDRRVSVRAIPPDRDELDGFVLLVFDELDDADQTVIGDAVADSDDVSRLESDLDQTRRRLRSLIEEYEDGQERTKASNEELRSANEELRSTMEELETSKEELQSMNEELATLNQENRHRVEELGMLSSDLQNLLISTEIATLFLDRHLHIVRFTPPISDLFNVVAADRGRPLSDFTHRLRADDLVDDARQVLERLVPVEREIESIDGRWLLTRVLPYRRSDDHIGGVVITFVDITRQLETERALRLSERRLQLSLEASEMGAWWWNAADATGGADERTLAIVAEPDDGPSFIQWVRARVDRASRSSFDEQLATAGAARAEFEIVRGDGRPAWVEVNARAADAVVGDGVVLGTIVDVTDRVMLARRLAERSQRLMLLSDAASNLLRGSDPGSFLQRLFDDMSTVLQVDVFEYLAFDRHGELRLVASRDHHGARPLDDEQRLGREACRRTLDSGEMTVRTQVQSGTDPIDARARNLGITAYACVPLLVGSESFGALGFASRTTERFDDDLLGVIRTIADYLAVAEQRLRAESALREANENLELTVAERTADLRRRERQLREVSAGLFRAEQRERERIAEVLHDDLQQLLYSAQMRLGLIEEQLSGNGDEVSDAVRRRLSEAARDLDEGIGVARSLSGSLAPAELDQDDLASAVRVLVDQMRTTYGLHVDLDASSVAVADKDTRTMLYRAVQELLFNVVKHAHTTSASVAIDTAAGQVDVAISDDGDGFDADIVDDPSRAGRGLQQIRHRLELMGGEMRIESIPGDGTRVRLRCPDGFADGPTDRDAAPAGDGSEDSVDG